MDKVLLEALNQRYAVKKFDSTKKLSQEQVEVILESVRLTATSYGLQLMKVVLVEDQIVREKMVLSSFGQRQVAEASHVLVLCRELNIDATHLENYVTNMAQTRKQDASKLDGFKNMMANSILKMSKADQEIWMDKQVYIALGNLLTSCAILGIDSCPMEGFKSEEIDELLDLKSQNLKSLLILPIGYRSVADKNSQLKKVRRPQNDFIVKIN